MNRVVKSLAVIALAIAGAGAPAAVAASSRPAAPPGLPVYLALGDSIATGQDSEAPLTADAYWAQVAEWKAHGYVAPFRDYLAVELDCLPAQSVRAADGCRQLKIESLARAAVPETVAPPSGLPGVTTALLIQEQLPVAEEQLEARNGDSNPRNDVEVITLTVGGNELFDAVQTGDPAKIQAAFTTFATNYATILGRLRAAAGPDTPILTMTYFNPLPYCGAGDPAVVGPLGDAILEGQPTPLGNGYNGMIRTLSAAFGAVPADTFGRLGAGDFFDCKHPDASGYAKITAAFEAAWEQAAG